MKALILLFSSLILISTAGAGVRPISVAGPVVSDAIRALVKEQLLRAEASGEYPGLRAQDFALESIEVEVAGELIPDSQGVPRPGSYFYWTSSKPTAPGAVPYRCAILALVNEPGLVQLMCLDPRY